MNMAERTQPGDGDQEFTFTNVQLLKNQILGTGSYGAVCKAKCDQLMCAAKLIWPALLQMQAPDPGKEHRQPFCRFESECRFLSRINHPNIVQYLGTYHDPETNATVLLMELMDESLTHFLESSPEDIPYIIYHVQVSIASDIAQALAFLHVNRIIHRDLSSNNVLLIAGSRAKVTDFGMFTHLKHIHLATMTTCPGTPAFMSPEALNEPPVYTDKLDNFSFGVLLVQIVTCQFPKPSARFETRTVVDPHSNQYIQAQVAIPEVERRQAHISLIEPTHPLLPIALDCLKDRDVERPSSQQLCQSLDALKRTARYEESSQQDVQQLLRAKDEQIRANQEQIRAKDEQLQAKDTRLEQVTRDIMVIQSEAEVKETQLRRLNQQLDATDNIMSTLQQAIAQRDRELRELRDILTNKNEKIQDLSSRLHQVALNEQKTTPATEKRINMVWESLPNAPVEIVTGSSAVIGDKAYFRPNGRKTIHEFNSSTSQWSSLPDHPPNGFTIVSVDNMLTTVGGVQSYKLYTFINNTWVEHFPPMPTKRAVPAAIYTDSTLVVAGGTSSAYLTTVEMLNIDIQQWSRVSSLPFPITNTSVALCGNNIYLRGGTPVSEQEKHSVLRCSLSALIQSKCSAVWENIASLPVRSSSLVTVNDHLLAVGGQDQKDKHEANIRLYNKTNNSWKDIGQISVARSACLTAFLPGNKLMVVGGYHGHSIAINTVEMTTFPEIVL